MSYEIVKTLRLEQKENGSWYAVVKSTSNNVYPKYYSEWTYGKDDKYNFTKEDLQKELLLDFYHGNLKGAKSTKYGKFMSYLGNTGRIWGCNNDKSRACNTYHFYDKLRDKLRVDYLATTKKGCWEFETEEYKKYCEQNAKIRQRQDREIKRYLYKEFCEFSDVCKPTIVRIWKQNWINKEWHGTDDYIYQRKKQRVGANMTNFENATKFTSKNKLTYIKKLLENNHYRAELIEV